MTHDHVAYGGPEDQRPCVDLGSGVCIRPFRGDTFMIAHPRGVPYDPTIHVGELCEGLIPTHLPGSPHPTDSASWERAGALEDGTLTLLPSIACRPVEGMTVGIHGYVTFGQWVPV